MPLSLLIRPEIQEHPYLAHCRVTVVPVPDARTLRRLQEQKPRDEAALAAFWDRTASRRWTDYVMREKLRQGQMFLDYKAKQGWHYLGRGLDFTGGPIARLEPRGIPNRPNIPKRRRGEPSVPIERIDRGVDRDYYVQQMPQTDATELWDYQLSGWFTKAVLTEFLTEVAG